MTEITPLLKPYEVMKKAKGRHKGSTAIVEAVECDGRMIVYSGWSHQLGRRVNWSEGLVEKAESQ